MPGPRCTFHVAIVGAGLGGLAAAIGILRAGHRVTMMEQASKLSEIGAGIQVPPNATRILKQWGLLEQIEAKAVKPRGMVIHSYRDGRVLHDLNLNPDMETKYGHPYLHIHRADYLHVLVNEAKRLGLVIQLDAVVTEVDFDTPCVKVQNKPTVYADVVVGADGLKSACREALIGRKDPPVNSGDLAYRIVMKCSDMKELTSLRRLVEDSTISYWMGPRSHAIGYQVRGGELYNLVVISPDNLPDLVNVTSANLEEMNDIFSTWDSTFRDLLGVVREANKWRVQSVRPVKNWSSPSGKFVLLGDACHATPPYLAQGAAQAFEDGAVLGELFGKITKPEQLEDCLTIYETIRKPRARTVVDQSLQYSDVSHLPDGLRQEERDRQLLHEEPFEGHPNKFADPVLQDFLFGYNVEDEVNKAWAKYLSGRFPGTRGGWKYQEQHDLN